MILTKHTSNAAIIKPKTKLKSYEPILLLKLL